MADELGGVVDGGGAGEEKTTLVKSSLTLPRYGTASSPSGRRRSTDSPDLFIRHSIKKDDTLNSIALKYGVTTNDIRSVNNIWSDNHICILDCLYIPLSKAREEFRTDAAYSSDTVTKHELVAARKKMNKSTSHQSQLSEGARPAVMADKASVRAPEQTNKSCDKTSDVLTKDYFSRFDSSLAKIKDNVDRLEKTSPFLNEEPNGKQSKKRSSRNHKSWSAEVESIDPTKEPQMRFVSQHTDSSLRQTLEHMEKTQDEIFQL